jgi:hypothetical protein
MSHNDTNGLNRHKCLSKSIQKHSKLREKITFQKNLLLYNLKLY